MHFFSDTHFDKAEKRDTHIGDYLDFLVLHFIEDVGVAERLQERLPCLALAVEELDELLQLCAAFLEVL